jgi:hypothetical protein
MIASSVPDCREAIISGESNLTTYPGGDLSLDNVAAGYGITESGACFGLFPAIYIITFTSPEAREFTTARSAWFACVLRWSDDVRYIYGPGWLIDAPYGQGLPGEDIAQLTDGTFVSQPCDTFLTRYAEAVGVDPPTPDLDITIARSVLGEG